LRQTVRPPVVRGRDRWWDDVPRPGCEHLTIRSLDVCSTLLTCWLPLRRRWVLFIGDDWAKDHHDVEIGDEAGRRLARARLPEGLAGMSRLRSLIGGHQLPEWADLEPGEAASRVKVGIETGRGPWVAALLAAGMKCSRLTRCRWRGTGSGT
jgi:hypothetical protein